MTKAKPIGREMSAGTLISTQDALDDLPAGTVIQCEIAEYTGVYELTNMDACCGGWHTFEWFDGEIEVIDDFTPELPATVKS